MSKKKFTTADRTANEALDEIEGRVGDNQLSSIARDLQRRQRILEQETRLRNERIRRARELAQGPTDDSAA